MAKDIDFSGFKSQNPLIEKNQVRTRNIDTQKIIVSIVEKNNTGVNTIPQIVKKSVLNQKGNFNLVEWTQTQFPEILKADLEEKIFEDRQEDKKRLEAESLLSEVRKILG